MDALVKAGLHAMSWQTDDDTLKKSKSKSLEDFGGTDCTDQFLVVEADGEKVHVSPAEDGAGDPNSNIFVGIFAINQMIQYAFKKSQYAHKYLGYVLGEAMHKTKPKKPPTLLVSCTSRDRT